MTRRIIIHIGPAKTGTSSLQETLYRAQTELLAQKVAYPTLGRHNMMPRLPGHHGLPAVLQAGLPLSVPLLEWIPTLPEDHSIILSSEDFSNLGTEQVAAFAQQLRTALPKDRLEVVYYARRWDRLLPSVWQELVKHGEIRSYPVFLNQQTAAPRASSYLNFNMVLDRWAQAFGRKAIRLCSFDNAIAQDGDVVAHFCRRILSIAPPAAENDTNASWPATATEILRLLNRLSFGDGPGNSSIRTEFWKAVPMLETEIAALDAELSPFIRRCRPCAPMVLHALEHDLLQSYGSQLVNPTPNGGVFAQENFKEAEYCDGDHLLFGRSLPLLHALHEKLGFPKAEPGPAPQERFEEADVQSRS